MDQKDTLDARVEVLRLIGAGNAAGLLGLTTFIVAGGRSAVVTIPAKICLSVFTVGVVAFGFAYWRLYAWRGVLEGARRLFASSKSFDDPATARNLHEASRVFALSGRWGICSLLCLSSGGHGDNQWTGYNSYPQSSGTLLGPRS
jgi:hypothetical protein